MTPTEPLVRTSAGQAAVRPPLPVKLVIAGGFGVGKTTAVGSISEIEPLTTEAAITEVAAGVDDLSHTPRKTTTTVAMDFGCITIDPTLKLYLFGTPGQDRFGFMWDDLVRGRARRAGHRGHPPARRLLRRRRLLRAQADPVRRRRERLRRPDRAHAGRGPLGPRRRPSGVPLLVFDARERGSVRDALLVVLEQALARSGG